MEALKQQRLSFKKKRKNKLNVLSEFENDENFTTIIEYTSGDFPYKMTYEEMEKITSETKPL